MSALAGAVRPRGRLSGSLWLALVALLLGAGAGRIAVSHYGLTMIVVVGALVLGLAGLALIARHPARAAAAMVLALCVVPSYRAPVVQHLSLHPMLVIAVGMAAVLWGLTRAHGRIRFSAVDLSVMLLVSGMIVALLFGPRSWKDAAGQLWLWLPPYLAGRLIAGRRPLDRAVALGTVAGGVLLTPFAVAEALGLGSPFFTGASADVGTNLSPASAFDHSHLRAGESFRVQTAFGHPIAFSMFIAVGIVFVLVLLAQAETVRARRLYAGAGLLLLVSETLAVSRTGFVVLGVAIFILAGNRARVAATKLARRALIGGLTALVVVALLVPSVAQLPLSTLGLQSDTASSSALQDSASYRGTLYTTALNGDVASFFGNATSKLSNQAVYGNSSIDSAYLNVLDSWGAAVTIPLLLVVGSVATRALLRDPRDEDGWSNVFAATATGLAVGLGSVALITQQEYLVWLAFGLAAQPHGATPLVGSPDSRGVWRFGLGHPMPGGPSRTNAGIVLRSLRRYGWIPALSAALACILAVGISRASGSTYTSSATLLLQAPSYDQILFGSALGASGHADRRTATDLTLLKLPLLAQRTASAIGHSMTKARVSREISLGEDKNSYVYRVAATDASPQLAAALANAYATQYEQLAVQLARRRLQHLAALERRQLSRMSPAQRRSKDGAIVAAHLNQLVLISALQNGNVEKIAVAAPPRAPSNPLSKKSLTYVGLVGLLLGIGLVAVLARRDPRLHDNADLETVFGLPVLGTVPAQASHAPTADRDKRFGLLRGQLRFFDVDRPLRSLLIASPRRGDGRTTVAVELAAAEAAAGGSRVLVIEADVREPVLAARLQLEPGPGLREVLDGSADVEAAIQTVRPANASPAPGALVDVLPGTAGRTSPLLLGGARMREVLAWATDQYDLVIVDTPAIGVVPDALSLLDAVAGVLVVVRPGAVTRREARDLLMRLRSGRAHVLGVAANAS